MSDSKFFLSLNCTRCTIYTTFLFCLVLSIDEITSSVKKDGRNLESVALKTSNSLQSPYPKEKCTWSQMNEFKDALLFYYCHKFVEPNCPLEVKTGTNSWYDEQGKSKKLHLEKNIPFTLFQYLLNVLFYCKKKYVTKCWKTIKLLLSCF